MTKKIFIRVVKAWLIGLFFAGLFVVPLSFISAPAVPPESLAENIGIFLAKIPAGLGLTFLFGAYLSLPLLLVAFVVALLCRKLIPNHRFLFTALSPMIAAIFMSGYFALTTDNGLAISLGFWARFRHILLNWDIWMFAVPVLASATYYCFYLRHPASDI